MISEQKIKESFKKEYIKDVYVYDTLDSTNSEAKRQLPELLGGGFLAPRILVAREQTAGRGRLGRSFYSPKKKGIYMSFLYFHERPIKDTVTVTVSSAVAVAKAIERISGKDMRIKWVNDIYDDSGKVCGILTEAVPFGSFTAVIIGVGINVGKSEFPEELRAIASSVEELEGKENELIAAIAEGLAEQADTGDGGFIEEYRKRFMLEGAHVDLLRAGERVSSGKVLGVNDDGALIFLPDGESEEIIISSGEVSVRNYEKE